MIFPIIAEKLLQLFLTRKYKNRIYMKSLKYIIATALAVIVTETLCAQNTKLLTADKHNEYGLVYTLPKTALQIEVTARRIIKKAGPYYQYAKKFVGTDNVIKHDSESWEITDVNVSRYGVADNDHRYLMQLKNGSTTFICVADDGMLVAINKQVDISQDEPVGLPVAPKEENIDINEYLQYVNEDFIASQSSAKRAQMLAENLMEIRDAKVSLTRGTAESMPQDGKQLELMLNSLSHQEASMTAAFIGIEKSETMTRTFTYMPEEDGKFVLFRMSDFSGFVGADDYSGDPVYLNVKVVSRGTMPVDAKGEEKKIPKDAVIYNIPGTAQISIATLGKTLYSKELDFAQYGVKFGLAPTLFSVKKERSYAIFDAVTGALTEIGEDGGQ